MSDGPRDAHRLFGGARGHADPGADPLRGRGDILREEQLKAAIERELAALRTLPGLSRPGSGKHRLELEARLIDTKLRVVDAILDHIEEAKAEGPCRVDVYYDWIIKLLVPAQE